MRMQRKASRGMHGTSGKRWSFTNSYKKVELSEIKSIAGVNAILLMTQPENLGGDAIVDVLTGNVNLSGKTADS